MFYLQISFPESLAIEIWTILKKLIIIVKQKMSAWRLQTYIQRSKRQAAKQV